MRQCIDTSSEISPESLAGNPGWGERVRSVLIALVDFVLEGQRRARERHQFASMDERMLRDIGLTRADAAYELDKWFWEK